MAHLYLVHAEGFKSIQSVHLQFGQTNVFIGGNGAGKSNFISLFGMLGAMAKVSLQEFVGRSGGASSLLHYGPKVTPSLEVLVDLRSDAERWFYSAELTPGARDALVITGENANASSVPEGMRGFHEPCEESGLRDWASRGDLPSQQVMDALGQWRVFQFHDTSSTARIRTKGYIEDNRALSGDAGNLAAFLYMLRETRPAHYGRVVETIRQVAPHFGDFDLEPDRLNETKILLNWHEAGSDYLFGPHQLPDGLLRFMALATLLLQPEDDLPNVVIIDEPELGLHPYAINVLGSLVRKAATRCQIILATQSVNLVDQFQPEDIITVTREDGASVFRRLDSAGLAEWLKDYSLGELWEKNVIGGRPSR